jgi:cysteine-rich repeat protein
VSMLAMKENALTSTTITTRTLAAHGARRSFAAAAVAIALVAMSSAAVAGIPATTANDVCPGLPNPCQVTQIYDVQPGAILDFGTNTVNVTGTGQFNFDVNNGSILSGPFTATTANAAIDANGQGNNGSDSGTIKLSARRKCSLKDSQAKDVPCVDGDDCQLGDCDTRRCTGRGTLHCVTDTTCSGICTSKHCSNTPTFVRCSVNADCNFGTCGAQLQCHNRDVNPVACSSNNDCAFGECSVGTASITMNGPIVGNSDLPASITMRAADNVTLGKQINLTGSAFDSDGGDLDVEAAAGSIQLKGKFIAEAGSDGAGGTIVLDAGQDVTVDEEIDVAGGDFDGGAVEINAGRDVIVNKNINASAIAGAGYGGEIFMHADRDMKINGASALSRTVIETTGHTAADNSAGDGGSHDISTGRDLSVNPFVRLQNNGATPNGYGSDVTFDVGRDLLLQGEVTAKSLGIHGQGGQFDSFAEGKATVSASATIDLTGGDEGGGDFGFESTNNTDFAGTANIGASTGGAGGSSFLFAGGDTSVSGTLANPASSGGIQEVEACRVVLMSTGKLDNDASNGTNRLIAHESMKLLAGSQMTTGLAGKNQLTYRTAAKPPLIQGTVAPAPQLTINPLLEGCPVCGNAEVDQSETCDDGNTANGDGCSSDCQNEKCISQTPGYPTVALCSDNDECSTDTCNTAVAGGTCQHSAKNCADAIACTTDSCNPVNGACVHAVNHTACNDNNDCTNDFCSDVNGCQTTPNVEPCDDGSACTENDVCVANACTGTPIGGCEACGDCARTGSEECDDGNLTFTNGEYCAAECKLVMCGDPNNSKTITSGDALITLRAGVALATCSVRVCDVDSNAKVNTTDALRILRKAVQQPVTFLCPVLPVDCATL